MRRFSNWKKYQSQFNLLGKIFWERKILGSNEIQCFCIIFQVWKLLRMINKTEYLDFICLPFAAFWLLLLEFLLWKKNSDMVKILHLDQLEKTHFSIVYRKSLHNVGVNSPCHSRLIFSICFLLLHGVMNPKIFLLITIIKSSWFLWFIITKWVISALIFVAFFPQKLPVLVENWWISKISRNTDAWKSTNVNKVFRIILKLLLFHF